MSQPFDFRGELQNGDTHRQEAGEFRNSRTRKPLQRGADTRRDGNRLVARAIDEDVHEVTLRARGVLLAEQADLIAHRRIAETADAQPCINYLGVREGFEEPALRLGNDADHRTLVNVEAPGSIR